MKNEEKNIVRCLDSLRGKVDEIIVVDTGCTDNTRLEVCRVIPGTFALVDFDWCDDFSAARNVSIGHAYSDFILYIDADEELRETFPGALQLLCENLPNEQNGYAVPVICPVDPEHTMVETSEQMRVFRNHKGFHFEGRVHEQLVSGEGIAGNRALRQEVVSIYHHGYVPDGDNLAVKNERNRRLLTKAIEDEPNNPAHYFYLAKQLAWEKCWEESIEPYEQAIDLWRATGCPMTGWAHSLFANLPYSLNQLGLHHEAVSAGEMCPEALISSELLYVMGTSYAALGQTEKALRSLDAAQDAKYVKAALHDQGVIARAREMAAEIRGRQPVQKGGITFNGLNVVPDPPKTVDIAFDPSRIGLLLDAVMLPLPSGADGVLIQFQPSADLRALFDRCEGWAEPWPAAS